jgi:hypothetical protein
MSSFLKFIGTPFEAFILPVIPAGAKLMEGSTLSPYTLGRVPGKWLSNIGAWTGFSEWQNHRATKFSLDLWQNWQAEAGFALGIGMQTAEFPVIDIDSNDAEIVDAIHRVALRHLGWSPVRRREDSPRRVLCYKLKRGTPPIRKMRLALVDSQGNEHIIETLGHGQQVVIEGPHASGKMHYWLDGTSLIDASAELVELTMEEAAAFMSALNRWAAEQGLTPVKLSLPTPGYRVAAVSNDDIMSPHLAKNMDLLARCVRAIDLNDDQLADYDTWIALLVAIKAACGGDRQFFDDVVLPWLLTNPANAEEYMEAKWNSLHYCQLGTEYLYAWGRKFGWGGK